MNDMKLELYWQDIPTDKENAVSYAALIKLWKVNERKVRAMLHELSSFDNGDNYVLIRSARNKGFYRTDDVDAIKEYKKECLNKGRSLFAPIKKINRVINSNSQQFDIQNNMRLIREAKGLTQAVACIELQKYDTAIDKAMLSKFENGVCLPTPYQLLTMARLYECEPYDIINGDLYY